MTAWPSFHGRARRNDGFREDDRRQAPGGTPRRGFVGHRRRGRVARRNLGRRDVRDRRRGGFRAAETEALDGPRSHEAGPPVVAVGGGAVSSEANRELMRASGDRRLAARRPGHPHRPGRPRRGPSSSQEPDGRADSGSRGSRKTDARCSTSPSPTSSWTQTGLSAESRR